MGNSRFVGGRFNECAAMVAGPQPPQAEIAGGKVVNTSFESIEVAANQIKLYFIKSACAGRRSEVDLATCILAAPSDAGGKVQELRDRLQIWLCLSFRRNAVCNGR